MTVHNHKEKIRFTLAPTDFSNSQFRGLKVVLADDDDVNRTVTKKLLEKLGCQVTAVSSGFECLGAISGSGNSFKIILLYFFIFMSNSVLVFVL